VLSQTGVPAPISCDIDIAFMHKLREFVTRVTQLNEDFEYATGLKEINGFFWNNFTDSLIELVKARARDENTDSRQRGSAIATLRRGLSIFVRLFAPVVPYITEEIWSWAFAEETGTKSIHRAPWPGHADFTGVPADASSEVFDLAVNCWAAINKYKAQGGVTSGRLIESLSLAANSATAEKIRTAMADVTAAARAKSYTITRQDTLPDGEFEVLEATFAEVV
jgi:valyl-tRNA synthetase